MDEMSNSDLDMTTMIAHLGEISERVMSHLAENSLSVTSSRPSSDVKEAYSLN